MSSYRVTLAVDPHRPPTPTPEPDVWTPDSSTELSAFAALTTGIDSFLCIFDGESNRRSVNTVGGISTGLIGFAHDWLEPSNLAAGPYVFNDLGPTLETKDGITCAVFDGGRVSNSTNDRLVIPHITAPRGFIAITVYLEREDDGVAEAVLEIAHWRLHIRWGANGIVAPHVRAGANVLISAGGSSAFEEWITVYVQWDVATNFLAIRRNGASWVTGPLNATTPWLVSTETLLGRGTFANSAGPPYKGGVRSIAFMAALPANATEEQTIIDAVHIDTALTDTAPAAATVEALYLNPFDKASAYHRRVGSGLVVADDDYTTDDEWKTMRDAWLAVVPANNGQPGGSSIGAINQGNPFGVAPVYGANTDPLRTIRYRNCSDTGTGIGVWQPGGTSTQRRIPDVNGINTSSANQCFENTAWIVNEGSFDALELFQGNNRGGGDYTGSIGRIHDIRGLGHGSALGERVGVSASGASVRMGMLEVGPLLAGSPIRHALKIAIYTGVSGHAYALLGRGIQWPACNADGTAGNPANNTGPFKYGTLMVIPASVDLESFGITTPEGLLIAQCLQDYGGYILDEANGIVVRADGALSTAIVNDYRKCLRQLRPAVNSVTNATAFIAADGGYNQFGSIGTPNGDDIAGGGTPRAINSAYNALGDVVTPPPDPTGNDGTIPIALRTHPVANAAQLSNALAGVGISGGLQPGDHIVLTGSGNFSGTFNTSKAGTADAPIVIRADTFLSPNISGRINLRHSYNCVYGLRFSTAQNDGNIYIDADDCRAIRNSLPSIGARGIKAADGARRAEIAYNSINGGTSGIQLKVVGNSTTPSNHHVHHNLITNSSSNPIEQGTNGTHSGVPSACLVEYNLVKNSGNNSSVAVKSSDHVLFRNTLRDCGRARMQARHGRRCIFMSNSLFNSAGILLNGTDHISIGNWSDYAYGTGNYDVHGAACGDKYQDDFEGINWGSVAYHPPAERCLFIGNLPYVRIGAGGLSLPLKPNNNRIESTTSSWQINSNQTNTTMSTVLSRVVPGTVPLTDSMVGPNASPAGTSYRDLYQWP